MGAMLNGQQRRTVRSRRSSSIIAQAIAILARYGGSLWVADSAYTFTGSDGTGAAGDGSDAGYVRDLCGNTRPMIQSTTGFKPKLRRVPKRLGAELVANGTFDTDISGWYRAGTTGDGSIGWSAGKLQCVRVSADAMAQTTMAGLVVGRQYQVSVTGAGGIFSVGSIDASIRNFVDGTVASFVVTATSQNLRVWPNATNSTVLFDNISVREVLEWTWAWVFDGTDDVLATVSQPAVTGETFIVAGKIATASVAAAQALMSKRTDINGSFLRRETTGATAASVVQSDGVFRPAALRSPDVDMSRHVYTQKITASLNVARLDGVQSGQIGCAPNPVATSIQIGAVLAARLNGEIYAAAYCPTALSDAELLIVERAQAQLGGITI